MESRTARPVPSNFVAQTFRGVFYPIEALRFIGQHKMWPMTLVAIGVNFVLLVAVLIGALYVAIPGLEALDAWLQPDPGSDSIFAPIWEALAWVGGWLVWILGVALIVAAGAVLVLLLGQAIASPFLDALSEKVEAIVTGEPAPGFSVGKTAKSIVLALTDLVWSLVYLVLFNIPVFLLGLVGVLAPIAAAATFIFTALVLAIEFVTMPAARDLVPYRKRFGMMWRNKWVAFGFGVAAMGILLVPGLNLVLLPLAAVGGTLAYCDLYAAGKLEA